jgi:hypothetical protein
MSPASASPTSRPGGVSAPAEAPPGPRVVARARAYLRVAPAALVLAAAGLFTLRALDVGRLYNHTFDEPTQIASGLELYQYGTFELHDDVPPLAKLLIAAPSYLAGVRLDAPPRRADWAGANRLLYGSGRYWFILRSARAVNTVIGALLVLGLAWAAGSVLGPWAGVAAAWCAACSPGLISAASIANSDIAGEATVVLALLAFRWLLLRGGRGRAFLFGLTVAAAVSAKLSSLPFLVFGLPVVAAFTIRARLLPIVRHPLAWLRERGDLLAVIVATVPLGIWATYGFHLAPPVGPGEAARLAAAIGPRFPRLASIVGQLHQVRLPLGSLLRGMGAAYNIAHLGHPAYLMGRFSVHGWPQYFLVTLLLKVPLGTLAAVALALGLALAAWRTAAGREVLLWLSVSAALLASIARAGINAGHRHIVVVEALFALVAAGGLALALARRTPLWRSLATTAVAAAIAAGCVASVRAHPDALGYTNALAGPDPSWWFVDSNLDWGQDLERLRAELAARGVTEEIWLDYFGMAEPARHGIRSRPLPAGTPVTGWIAVSVHHLRGMRNAAVGRLPQESDRNADAWLLPLQPVARIGTSIRLYHVAPDATPAATAP